MNAGWWLTTVLGVAAAVIGPLAANCNLGGTVCAVIGSIATAINAVIAVTHPGTSVLPPVRSGDTA